MAQVCAVLLNGAPEAHRPSDAVKHDRPVHCLSAIMRTRSGDAGSQGLVTHVREPTQVSVVRLSLRKPTFSGGGRLESRPEVQRTMRKVEE